MNIFKNVFGSIKTTVKGIYSGIGVGVAGAAAQFAANPQTTDWKPYAGAAIAAAVPVIIGAFSKDDEQPAYSETAKKVAQSIDEAGEAYAAKKADEVIARLQQRLAEQE